MNVPAIINAKYEHLCKSRVTVFRLSQTNDIMASMKNKTRLGILVITAFIMLILLAVVPYPAAGFSQSAPIKLPTLVMEQNGDLSIQEPLILTDGQGEYPLGLHMEILEDPTGELNIDQVSSPEFDPQFTPSQEEAPNYGFTNSVYWVRLNLDNETNHTDEWLLEVDFANTQYVDLYTPSVGGNGFEVKQTGILRPVSSRDILHPQIVFDLSIPTQSQQTTYLRFQNGASMTLGLTLRSMDSFLIHSQGQHLFFGLFFGVLIGLFFYNLFLAFSLWDINYLYFVIELAAIIFFMASYDGYMEAYIFPGLYYLTPYFLPVSFSLMFIALALFADSFLEVKRQFPKLHSVNLGIVVVWGMLMLLIPFTSYHFIATLMNPWAFVSVSVALVAGVVSLYRHFRPSWLFMFAWSGLLISLFIGMMARRGIIPITLLTENLFRLGMVWLGVCWSFALADHINILKTETESTNRTLKKNERRLSQILEGLPLGVVLFGKDHKPRYINQRTADILSNPAKGLLPDLSVEPTLTQVIQYYSLKVAGTDQEYPLENFPPSMALRGTTASADNLEMDMGDKRVPLEVWASPVMDEAGNVESAVVAFQDITQRKQSEAELVEYRRHLESLVGKRTAELDAVNTELRLRLEWLSAIVLITETMARSSDFTNIYEKTIEIINRLFAVQDSFIAELDEGRDQLKILAHSCRSEDHDQLKGSFTILPESILSDPNLEQGKTAFISKELLNSMSGPIGIHIQNAKIQGVVFTPLQLREQLFGFLGLELLEEERIISSEESNLLGIFSLDISHLIEDSRLFEQSKELITAEERNRLARDLHDSVTQTLFTASVLAEATPRIWDKDQGIARQNMDKLGVLIRGALAEMRSMLIELRSGELENQTLDQLLVTLVDAARARTHAIINLSMMDISQLPKNVVLTFYRIAREALNNAIIHAEAIQINVALLAGPGRVELNIQDDGCGFDPHAVPAGHLGIEIMFERVAEIGGEMQIHSKPDQGTNIIVTWPSSARGAEYD